jgi:serine/threonine protein kinase
LKEIQQYCSQYVLCYIDDVSDDSKGLVYLVCEYLDGYIDLFDYFSSAPKEFGYIDDAHYAMQKSIAQQLCEGLKYMHDMGLAHRDIKAENILLRRQAPYLIKYIDFGLSYMESDTYNSPNQNNICGTMITIDPIIFKYKERKQRLTLKQYQESDIFSLGIVIFTFLANGITPAMLHGQKSKEKQYEFNTNYISGHSLTLHKLFHIQNKECKYHDIFMETIYLNLKMAKELSQEDKMFGYFPDMVLKHKLHFPVDPLPAIDTVEMKPTNKHAYDYMLHA